MTYTSSVHYNAFLLFLIFSYTAGVVASELTSTAIGDQFPFRKSLLALLGDFNCIVKRLISINQLGIFLDNR